MKIAGLMEERIDEFARAESIDQGKPVPVTHLRYMEIDEGNFSSQR
jgi:acyl-CoA reductase-like NAD-dependent aldehyde dehydrogenase